MKTSIIYRQSRQRDRILQLLKETELHPTVDWLYEKLKKEFPKLSLGTVYRNLNILIERGLVQKIQSGSTFDRYEANIKTHYHLICETCGSIIDFNMPIHDGLNHQANHLTDFDVRNHRIDFFGICSVCRENENEALS